MSRIAKLHRGRPRRPAAAGAAAIGVVALATTIVIVGSTGSSKGASQSKPAGAATVQRRDLVSTDTESGTLGYANPQTVYNRVGGTITWLPAVGQQVKSGGTLYRVDNAPVILFDGTTPAYRTLASGVTNGPDVQELNANLVALGFDPSHEISVNDTWQTGTTDAVNRWQAALGQTQTGTVTLGQVVFLPGPQLVTTVETVLGSTGGSAGSSAAGSSSSSGSSSSGSGASASLNTTGSSHTAFVSLTSARRTPNSTTGPTGPTGPSGPTNNHSSKAAAAELKALTALLKAETAELRSKGSSAAGGSAASGAGSRSGAGGAGGGGGSGGGGSASGGGSSAGGSSGSSSATAILQTTSVQEVVTVDLDATKQTEAVVGEPVSVQLPNGNTVNGKITQVSPVAQSSSSSSSGSGSGASGSGGSGSSTPSATIPVTITLSGRSHVSGLDQAAVSVNFAQQKANNVLSVPVTALIATQGGGYAVQEATSPHTLVPVTPGLFAAGYVQISGSGIYPGLQVTDSQG